MLELVDFIQGRKMNFDQSSSYSKEDLSDCGNGELFGPKWPSPSK